MKKYWIVLFVIVMALSQSCSPVYIPTNSNVPLFTEKGELQLAAYHGSNGLTAQGAVSVIDHVAVIGNFGYSVYEDGDEQSDRKQTLGALGVGYYSNFSRAGRIEVYGGYGRGNSSAYDFFDLGDKLKTEAKFEQWFLQGNVGMGNKIVEGAVSYRLSYINFYDVKVLGATQESSSPMEELMMEPAFTIRVGGENLKFVTQAGISFPYDSHTKFDYQPFYISFGVMGKIPLW